jgi:S1-C subfamily serine protease
MSWHPFAALFLVLFAPAPLPRPDPPAYMGIDVKAGNGGVEIAGVFTGSPANDAGLDSGDIITALNDTPVKVVADLATFLRKAKPSSQVTVAARRGDEMLRIQLKLAPRRNYPQLGVLLVGATIEGFFDGSPAQAAGVQVNDVLVSLDGKAVSDAQGVIAVVTRFKPGDVIDAVVRRGSEEMKLPIKLGARPGY